MEIEENIARIVKNHDENIREHDTAKKQSEANPAGENLDMMPNNRNANREKDFLSKDTASAEKKEIANVNKDSVDYENEEHEKAANWKSTATDEDKYTF